jgi:predicted MFS family arabinose efflux permease
VITGLILHPVNLAAVLVLVVNDHWYKYAHPGVAAGKASDIAGLIVASVLALSLSRLVPQPVGWRKVSDFALISAVAASFAAAKVASGPNALAQIGLGGAVLRDSTDLLALPAVFVGLLIAWTMPARRSG